MGEVEADGKRCANCLRPLLERRAGSGGRGPDIAWMLHCRECAAEVADQLALLQHQPTGAPIDILQCRFCGSTRACRPGWRTRCPVCVDDRTRLDEEIRAELAGALATNCEFTDLVAEAFEISTGEVGVEDALMMDSALYLAERQDALQRPGWTLLATDVWGMPWPYRDRSRSHGSWAVHDVCGTVGKLTAGRPECRVCPPEPWSRTHRAKGDQPQLLYLVRYGDLLKFGHGDVRRVHAHVRIGCQPVQVLRGRHNRVVAAEMLIKRRFRGRLMDLNSRTLPATFGAGGEVIHRQSHLDLDDFLTGSDVADVTHQFLPGQ